MSTAAQRCRFELEALEARVLLSGTGPALSFAADTGVGRPISAEAVLVSHAVGSEAAGENSLDQSGVEAVAGDLFAGLKPESLPAENGVGLQAAQSPTTWSGDIPNGTVWAGGVVQRVVGSARVPVGSKLTIQPGAIIQFNAFAGVTLLIEGTLVARGTAANPILLTSVRDDTCFDGVLGTADDIDTNGDGPSKGAPGDWNALQFGAHSPGSVLDHVDIRFGGSGNPASLVTAGELTVTNSTFESSSGAGVRVNASNPILTANTFKNNVGPAISMDLESNPAISGVALTNNGINGLALDSGNLAEDGFWNDPDIVYWLTGSVTVPAGKTLTVAAGQVVKVRPFNGNVLLVNGTLSGQGTTGQPIIFTSGLDDTSGGDTNNDGATSQPGPDQWNRLEFAPGSTGNVLDHVEVRYGGSGSLGELVVNGAALTLRNSVVRDSSGAGVRIQSSNPVLTGNTFQNNASAAVSMDLASNPAISGVTLTNNGVNGLGLDGGNLTGDGFWDDPDIVYWMWGSVTVPAGNTLTVAAGQVVKVRAYNGNVLQVNGRFVAKGAGGQPIIFTSSLDDTAGGDTNNDGKTTTPSRDQWDRIEFGPPSTGNVLDHVEVRYGGSGSGGAVVVNGGALTLSNSIVRDSSTAGVRIQSSNPVLTGNTFLNNASAAVSMDLGSNPAISGVTATDNGINGLALDGGSLVGDGFWDDPDIVYWLTGSVTVPAGKTLTAGTGQVVKVRAFNGILLQVNGTLLATGTVGQPIIFTSSLDDSAGGDTNNDAKATSPARDQWDRIEFGPGATGNVLDHVEVRYGGSGSGGEVVVNGGALTLSNSIVRDSSTAGVRIQSSNPVLTGNTFLNNASAAVSMDLGSNPAISGVTVTNNGINGLALDGGNLVGNGFWDDPDIVYWLTGSVTVPAGKTLTVAPGQVVKVRAFNGLVLLVDGTLSAKGTAGQPILFTSSQDDSVGGDTNNDGTATKPGPDQWDRIEFGSSSSGNVLDHAELRDGGSGSPAELFVNGGTLSLSNSIVRDSSTGGLRIQSSSPVLTENTFRNNASAAISMDLASNPAINGVVVTGNGINGLALDGGSLVGDGFWDDPDIVYWLTGTVTVPAGKTLTVAAGQVVKVRAFNGIALLVNGTLIGKGTAGQPILFTSGQDDTVGGDTNNDGTGSKPGPDQWNRIEFGGTSIGNVLDHAEVRDGGSGSPAELFINGGALSLSNSVVRDSSTGGLRVQNSTPTGGANSFLNNASAAISADLKSHIGFTADSFAGNGVNGILLDSGTLSADLSLDSPGNPFFLAGDLSIPSGITLMIAAGADLEATDFRNLSGTGTINNSGTFRKSTGTGTTSISPTFINAGVVNALSGTLAFNGSLTVNGNGIMTGQAAGSITVHGNLVGNTQNAIQFAPQAAVTFNGPATSAAPELLEVMSRDLGIDPNGFRNNFDYYALALNPGAYVRLADNARNSTGTLPEALYIGNLAISSGATLDLNGLKIYARVVQNNGTVIGGSVNLLPNAGPLVLDTPTPGKLAAAKTVDDWTFFGRSGLVVTVTVGTGNAGLPAPMQPQMGFAQVTLQDSSGAVLGTAANTQSGSDATLTGVTLLKDGVYHLRVQAPAGQPSSTGNYVLTVWDATPRSSTATLNQTITGRIDTPYRIERWSFAAPAGQVLQIVLVNSESGGIQFDLTGPNGFSASGDQTTSSNNITLPTTGSYAVSVHTAQRQTGAYAFRIESVTVTSLALGTAFNGTLAGGAQSQLFKVTAPETLQLQVTLTDSSPTDRNEVYVKLGSAPTRGDYQFKFSTPASANQQVLVPTAAPGDWFILVYTESAPHPGNINLEVRGAGVFLTSVTPDHAGNGADMTLTLTGAGFDATSTVSLLSANNTAFSASSVHADLPTQITATFSAGSVPAGVYSVQVTLAGGQSATLAGAFTSVQGGQANLVAQVIVPNPIGLHIASTIYVEYGNTGAIAMPAPLLVLTAVQNGQEGALLTLDPALQVSGFWTSATPAGYSQSVQILASGATPGVLQPGESVTVPVYYAGWLTSQWDFSRPPILFNLGVATVENTAAVDWASMQSSLQPPGISTSAWSGLYSNLTAHLGATWGKVIQVLDQDAAYLGSVGKNVTDLSQLWGFEIRQANGLGPDQVLAAATDMAVPSVGPSMLIARTFGASIIDRNVTGPFGNGWQMAGGWEDSLTVLGDGTVVMAEGSGLREFQPDSRGGAYFAQPGDHGVLSNLGGGAYTLTDPTGTVTRFENGRVAFIQDANGNKTTAGYTDGLLTSLTAPSGGSITLAYNGAGRIIGLSNSAGQTAQYTYDATNQHLLSVKDYNGYTATYTYSTGTGTATNNSLLSITNPDGTQELFAYDAQGRLSTISMQGGAQASHYGYGPAGTVTVTNATNDATTYFYEDRGLLAKIVDPLHRATFYAYDAQDNLITVTDSAGAIYSYAYDSNGHQIQATNPLGSVTRFSYGAFDTLASVTDPKGNVTGFRYDQHGNMVSAISPDNSIETLAYNPLGEITTWTDRDNQVTNYAYNSAGQLTAKSYADGSQTVFGYDTVGNLTWVQDSTGTTTQTYDSANQLKKVTYPDSTYLEYTYDSGGRRTRMVDQTGFTINYAYNALGQLSALTDGAGSPLINYTYDANGRLLQETKSNATDTQYAYNKAGELSSIINHAPGGAVNSSFIYTYNNLGLCALETTLQGQWAYTYDAIGQLTQAVFTSNNPSQVPNQDLRYFYDAAGNRTKTIINSETTAYTSNVRNQYTSVGSTAYVYDANGNVISQTDATGTTHFTYNADNQLVAIQPATGSASTYQYNAFGGLYSETSNGQQTHDLMDPKTGNLTGQFGTNGSVLAHYTHGLGLVSQTSAASVSSYYDFDVRGSTVGLTNAAGAQVNTYVYAPFGGVLRAVTTLTNPFQFVGRWGAVGLGANMNLMGARAYNPATGQFLEEDPLGLAGGDFNVRRYAGNEPVIGIDPLGLRSQKVEQVRVISESEWNQEVQRMEDRLRAYDAEHPWTPDSLAYWNQAVNFDSKWFWQGGGVYDIQGGPLKGMRMEDHELNYYFQGMIAEHYHLSLGSLLFWVAGWKAIRYFTLPSLNSITAALVGYVTTAVNSQDPNDKMGPSGVGLDHFVSPNQLLSYRIDFENDPTATAPAQRVTVIDQLDPNLDWNTFALTEVGFGDTLISIPAGSQHFQTTLDMTANGRSFQVQIELGLHSDTGQVFATFQSIDPKTSLPPDVLTGFLLPEDGTGRGMGHFSYVITAKAGLAHGTQIRNVALITFDSNPSIATDQADPHDASKGTDPAKDALVTIDARPPQIVKAAVNGQLVQRSTISQIDFVFDEDTSVQFTPGALQLLNQTTGQTVSTDGASFSYNITSKTGTVDLSHVILPDGNYTATLKAAAVTDSGGLPLSQDYKVSFQVLAGDANGDGKVNDLDLYQVWVNLRKPAASRDLNADLDANGQVDPQDLAIVKSHYLHTLTSALQNSIAAKPGLQTSAPASTASSVGSSSFRSALLNYRMLAPRELADSSTFRFSPVPIWKDYPIAEPAYLHLEFISPFEFSPPSADTIKL